MNPKFVRRGLIAAIALPTLYVLLTSSLFVMRLRADNRAQNEIKLQLASPPTSTQRILIFSPHPDDETLGASGLIQQALMSGAHVRVVLFTNGDGFRVGVERQFRSLDIKPSHFVEFAEMRQQETLKALKSLGLEAGNVTFFGYPDGGLLKLWTEKWSPESLYVSPFTKRTKSPYSLCYQSSASYCGESVLGDVTRLVAEERPTDVYVTHPSDDHVDHAAASAFVTSAVRMSTSKDPLRLHYYLVHRGDWPVPRGLNPKYRLVPPREMAHLDTDWAELPLSDHDRERKLQCITTYASQTAIMKPYLESFVRQNEMFGVLGREVATRVPTGSITVDGKPGDWEALPVGVLDPVNDNLLRDFQAGGDVKSISACRDSKNLYLRVETFQEVSSRIRWKLHLRGFMGARSCGARAVLVSGKRTKADGIESYTSGTTMEISVPLRDLGGADQFGIMVETDLAGIVIDRTGIRFFSLAD